MRQYTLRRACLASGRAWVAPEPSVAGRLAARWLRQEASRAARARDHRKLASVDRALAFLRRGHTAGERRLLERLAAGEAESLATIVRDLPPPAAEPGPVRARIVSLLLVLGPD